VHPGEGDDQGCWQQWRTDRDREEQRRIAQQRRDRKVRNKLSRVVAVLDELLSPGQQQPRCLGDVADFYQVSQYRLSTVLEKHREEFSQDGWRPHNRDHDGQDLWTDRAVVRAGLLLEKSAVAAHLRHLLGVGDIPLVYSQGEARLAECRQLYNKALTVVADIHGESSPDELWRAMQGADRYDLMAMAMTLAALTPYDRPSLGQWLREISGLTTKDGSIARGLALLIPQRQAVDVRKLKEPGSARSNRLRADGEGAVCQ
jgi:hypothetical protein